MIGAASIEDMRKLAREGETVAGIARKTGVSEPTAGKYRDMEDLSPKAPGRHERESPTLRPFEKTIDGWLEEDRKARWKQRHTAARIYARLRDEEGYEGSYSTVQRYVRRRREETTRERGLRGAQGYLELEWTAGECQVDFGEADFRVRGAVTRGKYLTVSFPHSNVGIAQVFWGETSECVCEGLKNVFAFIGGVPPRAVFDNATEVGRRFGTVIRTSELFRLFSAHYGFDYSFTNPYSGNEKGNVEAKVGYTRRNLFVPMPAFSDARGHDRRLMQACLELSRGKPHWRLGEEELSLFEGDRAALQALPPQEFSCVRWEQRKCNKQGVFTLAGIHRYSAGPGWAQRSVTVALSASGVTVVDPETAEVVATYERQWRKVPTSSSDPVLQLKLLCARPGGFRDSVVRQRLPEELVRFLDNQDAADLGRDLRMLRDESGEVGWQAAVEGMRRALELTGSLDEATVGVSAAVAASRDARVSYDEEVDLSVYDGALRLVEGGGKDGSADELQA